jgi:hypothetical protein
MKIDFEFDTPYGIFRDAIILFDGQTLSDAEITEMKQARVDAWIYAVENPPPPPPPETVEIDGVIYQKV